MDSIKVLIIAVVAALTPLLALAPGSGGASKPNPQLQTVDCRDKESETVTVSVPNSTVDFVCQSTYKFEPAVIVDVAKQNVYSDALCQKEELLTNLCPSATLKAGETTSEEVNKAAATLEAVEDANGAANKPAATLKVPELPVNKTAVFYVRCNPPSNLPGKQKENEAKACVVTVTVKQAPNKGVHICRQGSITVNVLEKDSSVQFSCDSQFRLYPTDLAKVFKDDCKTEEPLKDMRRTAPAAAGAPGVGGARSPQGNDVAPTVYTLKAVEKPPKRKLCYLCAKQQPTDRLPKPSESYCAIYVESSARAPFGLGSTPLAFILCSVLAVLGLT